MWGEVKEVLLGLCVYCYLFAIPASLWGIECLVRVISRVRRPAPARPVKYILDLRRVNAWQR